VFTRTIYHSLLRYVKQTHVSMAPANSLTLCLSFCLSDVSNTATRRHS